MIGAGLTCRVRGAGLIGGLFGKEVFRAFEVAIDFIGGDVVKAKVFLLFRRQAVPVLATGFKQGVGADDIGLDEVGRAAD
ncbi:hypothetical protein D3C80_1390450 [compost metagenome]